MNVPAILRNEESAAHETQILIIAINKVSSKPSTIFIAQGFLNAVKNDYYFLFSP